MIKREKLLKLKRFCCFNTHIRYINKKIKKNYRLGFFNCVIKVYQDLDIRPKEDIEIGYLVSYIEKHGYKVVIMKIASWVDEDDIEEVELIISW